MSILLLKGCNTHTRRNIFSSGSEFNSSNNSMTDCWETGFAQATERELLVHAQSSSNSSKKPESITTSRHTPLSIADGLHCAVAQSSLKSKSVVRFTDST
eukprot:50240-Pelagomonas_calceolata.AAC.12